MSLFKRKKVKAKEYKTIQEVQADFNTVVFNIGRINYQLHMVNQGIEQLRQRDEAPLKKELKDLHDRADQLGQIAQKLSSLAKEEVLQKVAEGQPSEEAPKQPDSVA